MLQVASKGKTLNEAFELMPAARAREISNTTMSPETYQQLMNIDKAIRGASDQGYTKVMVKFPVNNRAARTLEELGYEITLWPSETHGTATQVTW